MLFKVTWTIDIEATDHIEAARKAREIQLDHESTATIFEVGLNQTVDLLMGYCIHHISDNVPCKKCGRLDLPLHFNMHCTECFTD